MHVRVAYMILRHQEKMKVPGPEGWGVGVDLSSGPQSPTASPLSAPEQPLY